MNEQERLKLIDDSVKARKLVLPEHLRDLPCGYPNLLLLSDEAADLLDERYELVHDFVLELSKVHNIVNSCWSMDDYVDFTANPFAGAIGVHYRCREVRFRKHAKNVTLLDIWKACDKLIKHSGDNHHVFIEELTFDGEFVTFMCGS